MRIYLAQVATSLSADGGGKVRLRDVLVDLADLEPHHGLQQSPYNESDACIGSMQMIASRLQVLNHAVQPSANNSAIHRITSTTAEL